MAKHANIRGIFLLVLVCMISGCAISGGHNYGPSPTPTPTSSPTAHSVSVVWDSSLSTNLQGYKVYRSQTSGGPYTSISPLVAVSTQQFTDSSVLSGQTYFYVVTSVDMTGLESGPSPEVNVTIP